MPLWWLQLLLVAAWLFLAFARAGFWREFLKWNQPPDLTGAPSVVAVVPARNEAATVAKAIGSLAAQNYPGEFRIVLCDDGSTDGTARLAKGADIVTASPLPAGWTGKLWAMREAVRVAEVNKPDYYLFTDADITHDPANLQSLVARAQQGYDLVSYMATLNCRTPAEQLLIPAFVYFFFLLYPPALVRNPRSSAAGAAGGCILVRREALDRAGGLEAIRGELIDDCALAKAVKRTGGRVYLSLSPETRSIRQYDTAGEIERMIARTAFTQLHYSFIALIGCTLGLMFAFLIPLALPPGGTIAWAILTLTYIPALRFYNVPAWQAPLLPFVALYYLKATWHSAIAYYRGEGGAWKGRVLPR
ncbi:MAG TPA: glycosyltransferase [Candidatus Limnocylindrales bacterium]|nr:glycosyltransferase [Candidatus Limnocylindrales bacterium]